MMMRFLQRQIILFYPVAVVFKYIYLNMYIYAYKKKKKNFPTFVDYFKSFFCSYVSPISLLGYLSCTIGSWLLIYSCPFSSYILPFHNNLSIVNFKINGQLPSKQDSHSKAKISDHILPQIEIFITDFN